jgi:HAAS domain-containing protein
VIESYLRELEQRLPVTRRRRFLKETEAHLVDCAERHVAAGASRDEAERLAVEAFGPPDELARQLAAGSALRVVRGATLVNLVVLASLLGPLYLIPENTLPPAPWDHEPVWIERQQYAMVLLYLAAVALAAVSAIAAWRRHPRWSAYGLAASSVGIAASGALALSLSIYWYVEVPGTPVWSSVVAALWGFGVFVVAAAATLWVRDRARAFVQD